MSGTGETTDTERPKSDPRRIESWVHRVINPMIEQLESELELLATEDGGDITFDRRLGGLQYVRALQDLLSPADRPFLTDFLLKHPKVREAIEDRDRCRQEVEDTAHELYLAILSSEAFKARLDAELETFAGPDPTAGFPRKHLEEILAAHIVNRPSGDLPDDYHAHAFWGSCGPQLVDVVSGEGLQVIAERLALKIESLNRLDSGLLERLVRTRFDYCERFELPAAPYPPC